MLYLVYDIDNKSIYKMELNKNQLKFLKNAIPDFLYIFENIEIINSEDKEYNYLYFVDNEFLGANLIYSNKNTNRLLKKLGFKVQKYDCIEKIDFYDWCLINKKEIEICLDEYDYEDSDYKEIFKKIFEKSIDK